MELDPELSTAQFRQHRDRTQPGCGAPAHHINKPLVPRLLASLRLIAANSRADFTGSTYLLPP